jgi:hypothetical protein
MPTQALGPAITPGPGSKTCTVTGGTLQDPLMKLGPDGLNWVVYTDAEVAVQCATATWYRHVSNGPIPHLCAAKSGWAFTVYASTLPKAVTFLHIRSPAKLDEMMGPGSTNNWYDGGTLHAAYIRAKVDVRSPRLWRRNVPGWDEIAINFCLPRGLAQRGP